MPTTNDFTFVKKEEGQISFGRVGAGPCGKVFEEFSERSPSSHWFMVVKDDSVIQRLRNLQDEFRSNAHESSSSVPVISKRSLIQIYENSKLL
jgi:hypothetical protein